MCEKLVQLKKRFGLNDSACAKLLGVDKGLFSRFMSFDRDFETRVYLVKHVRTLMMLDAQQRIILKVSIK